jgi:hypothetical protein
MNETLTYVDLHDAGNAQAQLVLYAIARHANWDTGRCWPGQTVLARMAKCSERTLRTYLKKLEADGLIKIDERRDEHGARQSDLITLVGYEMWIKSLREGGKIEKPKKINDYSQPENLAGCLPEKNDDLPAKNGEPTGKQVAGYKEPSLNNKIELDARAREDSKFCFSSEVPPRLVLRGDPNWRMWHDWVFERWGHAFADAFTKEGAMVVFSSAPSSTAKQPKLPPSDPTKYNALFQARTLTQRSKDMTGDAA